jgi:tryptophanyl-tRNA synthetase
MRLLTGDRPTGRLHLGHYVGSLKKRVELQDKYETYLLVADLHMLTTKPDKAAIEQVLDNARGMVLDHLACGIDPAKVTIYLQSAVQEVYELNLICEMLTTVNRLSRLPSLKEMARAAHLEEMPFGLLGYPVLMTADILLPKADVVPIGKDNEAHLEIARQIARNFNAIYSEVFPVPECLLGDVPTLVGTDGKQKMSKSLDNAIYLSDEQRVVEKKVRSMFTDPNRVHAHIPGTVEGNPVFVYHDAFNDDRAQVEDLKERYRKGTVGDAEVKALLSEAFARFLAPMRERYETYGKEPALVDKILFEGTERMREVAKATMKEVRSAMGIGSAWNRLRKAAERRRKKGEDPGSAPPAPL